METCSADSYPVPVSHGSLVRTRSTITLLLNWRHLWRNGGLQPPGEHEPLLPVTLTPEPDNKIPAPVQIPERINALCQTVCAASWFCQPELQAER